MYRYFVIFCACWAATAAFGQTTVGHDSLGDSIRELVAGRPDVALTLLEKALKETPPPPELQVLALRGTIALEQGKFEEAIAAFSSATEKEPFFYGPRLSLGDTLLRAKKWAEARAAYEKVMADTNILILHERMRYAILLTFLGEKNETEAKAALDRLVFPTESPSYYYAQAAWAFAHDKKKDGAKWLQRAEEIFDDKKTAWYARPLYEFGWIKTKPAISVE